MKNAVYGKFLFSLWMPLLGIACWMYSAKTDSIVFFVIGTFCYIKWVGSGVLFLIYRKRDRTKENE